MGSFARVLRQGLCAAVAVSCVLVPVVAQAIESQELRINEVRSDESGTDNNEYFELRAGAAGANLAGVTYLVVGDGAGGSGVIEAVVTLPAVSLDPGEYYVVAETTYLLGTPDLWLGAGGLNFENTDNTTHFLVRGFSGANGNDLDTNDDGVLDFTPWTSELDRVALIMQENPPATTEWHYGPPFVGPYIATAQPPYHAYRNGTGWHMGSEFIGQPNETPGAVNPDEDIPGTAMPDSYTVDEDTWLSPFPVDGLFVNDYDVDYLLSILTAPLHSAEFGCEPLQGIFEYLPEEDFVGQDRFVYVGQTTAGYETAPATVTITVLPVDDPPQIHPELGFSTDEDEVISLASMDWGDEVDGETLQARRGAGPSHGILLWDDDRSLPGTYIPDPQYHGPDSFEIALTDGISWTDTGTVDIEVEGVNDSAVAVADAATVNQGGVLISGAPGVLANDSDIEADPMTAMIVDDADHGMLALAPNGQYIYLPDADFGGSDSFSYRVWDGNDFSNTATVTITVRGKTALTASADATIAYGSSYTFSGALTTNGSAVVGAHVVLETSIDGVTFSASSLSATTGSGGSFSFPGLKPERKTWYRARFALTDTLLASTGPTAAVSVKPYVRTPIAPAKMSKSKYYAVYGYLKPRHTAGSYPVRIYKYRYVSGRWKSYGYTKAKAYDYSDHTKYYRKIRLPYVGKWRLRAYAPADSQHASVWSSGYDYVTVK